MRLGVIVYLTTTLPSHNGLMEVRSPHSIEMIFQLLHRNTADTILVLACVIDITTATIPQFLLWKVKMRDSTKRSLNIIFALGLVTAAMSIGRVATINYGTVATDISCMNYICLVLVLANTL